jgi:hypothetical protein
MEQILTVKILQEFLSEVWIYHLLWQQENIFLNVRFTLGIKFLKIKVENKCHNNQESFMFFNYFLILLFNMDVEIYTDDSNKKWHAVLNIHYLAQ